MTVTALLALSTSALFGVGDFLGGVATRRDSAYAVTATSHLLSLALLATVVWLVLPAAAPTTRDLALGAVSGLSGVVGVVSLFSALAVGRMSIVAPVTAALSASLPALWDLAGGTRLAPLTLAGIGLALVAIVIVSIAPESELHLPEHPYRPRLALALSVLSGVGFGGAFIAFSYTGQASGLVPILAARCVSITVASALAVTLGQGPPIARRALGPALGSGVTDALASVTMLLAVRLGPLALASVLSALYPVVVAFLARVFLGERLTALQKAGVAVAMVAVLLASVG